MSTEKTGSDPAFPLDQSTETLGLVHYGLTQRQYACLTLRIPESGEPWLDEVIAKAQRRDVAAMILGGMSADPSRQFTKQECAKEPVELANDLLLALNQKETK